MMCDVGVSGAESRSSKPGGERLNFSGLDGQSPEYVSTAQQELAGGTHTCICGLRKGDSHVL